MIEINLLPDGLKKKEGGFKKLDLSNLDLRGIPVIKIAIGAAAILVTVHALLFSIAAYSNTNIKELSGKYNGLLPNVTEAQVLKERSQMMIKKVGAINELMVNRFSWAKKLDALGDSMTPGIWLTDISYEEKIGERAVNRMPGAAGPGAKGAREFAQDAAAEKRLVRYLVLSGCASSPGEEGTAVVGKFIKSLKENRNFYSDIADIELGSIRSDKIEDQEVMRFRITCAFKG